MEIISLEARAFEAMMSHFESLTQKVEAFCEHHKKRRLKVWLDNQDVCQILNIDKRTLLTYRDKGLLPFSRIRHKILYKPEDVEKLLQSSAHPSKSKSV